MNIDTIKVYKQHPIATTLMPGGMAEPEFTAFCADIESRGVLMPVTLYEGLVLDGWHRYRAAQQTGSAVKYIVYDGKDPAGYIASVNIHRRKLSSLQRALVGCRLHRDHGMTQRDACKKLGISNEVVTLVLRAIDSKSTKIIKRIEDDSEFSRNLLKEELEDMGMLSNKKKVAAVEQPKVNSVFELAANAAAEAGQINVEVDLLHVPVQPKQKPLTEAQRMAVQYEALEKKEKCLFLASIWPTAEALVKRGFR